MDPATAMMIDGQQAFGMIGTVLWTMLRTGAMLMAMPLLGTRAVPARIRVLMAGALAMAISPLLPPPPQGAGIDASTVLGVARELALGVAMGFALRLVFEAGALAGELGLEVVEARSSDEIRAVDAERPLALVVLDVNMPGGGVESNLATIAARTPRPRVLLLSGEDAPPALEGVDAAARKPIELASLQSLVTRLLAVGTTSHDHD